jgi:hypothetical protein
MSALNLKNLSPKQEEILQEIWRVCEYFEVSRNWNVEDRLLAEQAKNIGSAMCSFRREENKRRDPTG